MSTAHIAGYDVQINNLLRQRCAWCGHLLIDYDLDRLAATEDPDPEPETWPVGFLVEVDGGVSVLLDLHAADGLPDNACSRANIQVEAREVTR